MGIFRRRTVRASLLTAGILFALVLTIESSAISRTESVVGGRPSSPADGAPVVFSPVVSTSPQVPSGPTPQASLERIIAGMAEPAIASASLATASSLGDIAAAGALILSVTLPVSQAKPDITAYPEWLSYIAAGRMAEASDPASPLEGVDITLELPNGNFEDVGGGLGNAAPHQVFTSDGSAQTAVEAAVRAAARGMGLPVAVTFVSGGGITPVVRLTSTSTAEALSAFQTPGFISNLLGSPDSFEGWFVAITDATGRTVALADSANRAGVEQAWAASSNANAGAGLAPSDSGNPTG